jgi:hypothetical protein
MATFYIPDIITYSEDTANYNCFCSLDSADDYHARRLNNDAWRQADVESRISALFNATDILHRQKWLGAPTTYSQALAWPRRYVPNRLSMNQGFSGNIETIDSSSLLTSFEYLGDEAIPQFLIDATSELANYLLLRSKSGKNEVSQYSDQLSSLTLGGMSMTFREEEDYFTDMPHQVLHIVKDFLKEISESDPSVSSAYSTPLRRS